MPVFDCFEKIKMLRKFKKILSKKQQDFLIKTRNKITNSFFQKLTQEILQNIIQKNRFAIIVFDHQVGGGAGFYLNERIDAILKRQTLKCYNDLQSIFYSTKDSELPSIAFIIFFKNDSYFLKIVDEKGNNKIFILKNLNVVRDFFYSFDVREIFLNELVSFKNLDEVTSFICEMVNEFKTPLTIPIHDYYALCPRKHLLDENNQYCELKKDFNECSACAKKYERNIEFKDIVDFRSNFERLFNIAREIIIFSESSQKLLFQVFNISKEKLKLEPHQVNYLKNYQPKLRVGILGDWEKHKGSNEILQLANLCAQEPFEFVFFGKIKNKNEKINLPKNLRILGGYNRQLLPALVCDEKIDIFLIPSICPETFSYTTHEVIALNLPLISFPLGAQAESIAHYSKGRIAKNISAYSLKDELLDFYFSTVKIQ